MNEINKYLNYLMKEAIGARFNMVSGKDVVGRVKGFDDNTIVLEVKKKLINLSPMSRQKMGLFKVY